jgi:hypothetical protein
MMQQHAKQQAEFPVSYVVPWPRETMGLLGQVLQASLGSGMAGCKAAAKMAGVHKSVPLCTGGMGLDLVNTGAWLCETLTK